MYNVQQKQVKQTLQVKFHQGLSKFRSILTLPEYNFMQDVCLGIVKSKSVLNHKIAGTLLESVTVKKTCERFTRHLNKKDLCEKLQSQTIQNQCQGFGVETGIIVDESDIIKLYATKMEGLQTVRDGSTGKHDQLGYSLLNTSAFQDSSEGYELKPISSDLIARDLELDSVSQLLHDRLIDIAIASGNKGVYLFDRGYDSRNLFAFLQDNGMNYICRSTGDRNLIVDGKERNFHEVAHSVKLTTKYKINNPNQLIECGIRRVKLRLNPHPRKHPDTIDTWLVVARFSPDEEGKQGGFFYFLCDFPSQPELTADAIAAKAIRMYRMRWKIEEAHRHIKQEYGWEKMQLTSYTRLKNMNQLLLIAMCYLYSLKKVVNVLLEAFPSIMKYSNKRWKKVYDFVYYKLSALLQSCFMHIKRYDLCPYAGKWHDQNQLQIPFMKNGGM